MADDHSDLAEAVDHLGTAINNVAASTPSGAPHAMMWVERAKMAVNAWRQKFMPQPEPEPEPEVTADDGGSGDSDPPPLQERGNRLTPPPAA